MSIAVDQVIPGDGNVGVLLLHGLTGTSGEMAPLAEGFAGRYPLWLARIAGHETTVEDLAQSSWRDWYVSAEAGLDALAQQRRRIITIGLSMGAMLAVRLAVERADLIAGVVLLSPAIGLRRFPVRRLARPLRWLAAADARVPRLQRLLAPLAMTKGGSDISDLDVRSRHPGYRQVPFRALLNLLTLQRFAWEAAPRVAQPALVMHARNDHTCPIEASRLFSARLGSREKRMVELERSFHVITVDCERDRVLAEVDAFVAALATGSSST